MYRGFLGWDNIVLYKEYGKLFDVEFSQFRRRSILQQKKICDAYTFHIIYTVQFMKHKNNVLP